MRCTPSTNLQASISCKSTFEVSIGGWWEPCATWLHCYINDSYASVSLLSRNKSLPIMTNDYLYIPRFMPRMNLCNGTVSLLLVFFCVALTWWSVDELWALCSSWVAHTRNISCSEWHAARAAFSEARGELSPSTCVVLPCGSLIGVDDVVVGWFYFLFCFYVCCYVSTTSHALTSSARSTMLS